MSCLVIQGLCIAEMQRMKERQTYGLDSCELANVTSEGQLGCLGGS